MYGNRKNSDFMPYVPIGNYFCLYKDLDRNLEEGTESRMYELYELKFDGDDPKFVSQALVKVSSW